jgi:hypothetical protein
MLLALGQLNWLAVLAATIAHFVLAGLWFGALVAKPYAASLGIADRPAARPGALMLGGPLLCSAVMIASSALLLRALGVSTLAGALGLGASVAIGYVVPMTITIAINPLFPHPLRYALVNAPLFVLGQLLACAILFLLS